MSLVSLQAPADKAVPRTGYFTAGNYFKDEAFIYIVDYDFVPPKMYRIRVSGFRNHIPHVPWTLDSTQELSSTRIHKYFGANDGGAPRSGFRELSLGGAAVLCGVEAVAVRGAVVEHGVVAVLLEDLARGPCRHEVVTWG